MLKFARPLGLFIGNWNTTLLGPRTPDEILKISEISVSDQYYLHQCFQKQTGRPIRMSLY